MVLSRSMMFKAKNTLLNLDYHVASEICFQPFFQTPALVALSLLFFLRDVTVARVT